MLVIHIIHKLLKLFTLKRSRFKANFTLKHSRFSAETLPLSIDTYIYLYKNTCSYKPQIVNNFFSKILVIFFVVIFSVALTGCNKTIYICDKPINKISVNELPATYTHPAQFYLCGNDQYLCKSNFHWHEIEKCQPASSKLSQGNVYEKCEKITYYK